MVGFGMIVVIITTLALLTIHLRFQEVDYRVAAANLQERLRRAEDLETRLRSDIAYARRAENLKATAEERLGLSPAKVASISELTIRSEDVRQMAQVWGPAPLPDSAHLPLPIPAKVMGLLQAPVFSDLPFDISFAGVTSDESPDFSIMPRP